MRKIQIFVFILSVQLAVGQTEFSAHGFDALRIENEIKLTIPNQIVDSVWTYLSGRYDNDSLYLKSINKAFNTQMAVDSFVDQYFDNKELSMLKMESGVRHRTRYVLTDSTSRKNERELMQLKINNIGNNELSRGEYKYKVKHYDVKDKVWDRHPFLGLVKRKHRNELIERLKEYEINAADLFPTIKITQIRRRIYISKYTTPFATLTLDEVTAEFDNEETKFTELELELNEIGYTESNPLTRAEMERVNEIMKSDVLNQFPQIVQDQTPKYNKSAIVLGLTVEKLSAMQRTIYMYWIIGGLIFVALAIVIFIRNRRSYF